MKSASELYVSLTKEHTELTKKIRRHKHEI